MVCFGPENANSSLHGHPFKLSTSIVLSVQYLFSVQPAFLKCIKSGIWPVTRQILSALTHNNNPR